MLLLFLLFYPLILLLFSSPRRISSHQSPFFSFLGWIHLFDIASFFKQPSTFPLYLSLYLDLFYIKSFYCPRLDHGATYCPFFQLLFPSTLQFTFHPPNCLESQPPPSLLISYSSRYLLYLTCSSQFKLSLTGYVTCIKVQCHGMNISVVR